MTVQRRSSSSMGVSVRRYLSETDEKEALRRLQDQLRRQKRVTSDDIRLAVRAVASKGGSVAVPPDWPPSRWVLEFKRVHGFVQFNSFAFGAAASGKAALGLSAETTRPAGTDADLSDRRGLSQQPTAGFSSGASSDDEKEKEPSERSRSLLQSAKHGGKDSSSTFDRETQKHTKMQAQMHAHLELELHHNFEQRHRRYQQQQQQRLMLVEGRRGTRAALREAIDENDEQRSNTSSASLDSRNSTTPGTTGSINSAAGTGARNGFTPSRTINENHVDKGPPDTASSASSDKRGYKQSHTVPAETWEKAIAAVELQGMSLRAAAKVYGVHFAALHRRVKKRAQGGLSKGNSGYFHPSDEAGIVRVVVARAELGVLMTFGELMALVEASALRKLPDISVSAARALLARFQSRNEQSIRHIIEDWPPPRPSAACRMPFTASASSSGGLRPPTQREISLRPGSAFQVGRAPQDGVRRSMTSEATGGAATAAAVAAAVSASGPFVPPSRVGPLSSRIEGQDKMRELAMRLAVPKVMERGRTPQLFASRSFSPESPYDACIEPQQRAMEVMSLNARIGAPAAYPAK